MWYSANEQWTNQGAFLFHAIATIQFAGAVYYDCTFVHVYPKYGRIAHVHPKYGLIATFFVKLKFATFCNTVLQLVYFLICILNDVYGTNEVIPKRKSSLRSLKDYMYAAVAFPIAMFVGVTFWGLWAVDRELVFPKVLDAFFPTWLNHVMHTNIMIFTLMEMVLLCRRYPTRSSGFKGLGIFMLAYLTWTFYIYLHTGTWVYPVLRLLSWSMRLCFFVGSFVMAMGFYLLGEFLNSMVWGAQLVKQTDVEKEA